ncbi:exodeoxyribonuclease VII large subunit, partial [Desulfovibrio sp. 1214_IL3152]|uniref:exodeoxyribonuclease VII large subunit n=1 Tax=Desulfovibrio sp. 1214_IL3152 TaxID=3084056 RepID=UPI002FDA5FCC
MQEAILTVRELTEQLRKSLEGRFPFVWVRGEVTNFSRPGSGHVYFSLKDQDAQLQCVWFRHMQRQAEQGFDPLTGEVFDEPRASPLELLRNGLDVLCAGRISVYAPRGQYQLAVELVQPAGVGLLAQAFEAGKRKLAALGWGYV